MSAQLVLLEHIQDQAGIQTKIFFMTASQMLVPLSQLDPLAEGAEENLYQKACNAAHLACPPLPEGLVVRAYEHRCAQL